MVAYTAPYCILEKNAFFNAYALIFMYSAFNHIANQRAHIFGKYITHCIQTWLLFFRVRVDIAESVVQRSKIFLFQIFLNAFNLKFAFLLAPCKSRACMCVQYKL